MFPVDGVGMWNGHVKAVNDGVVAKVFMLLSWFTRSTKCIIEMRLVLMRDRDWSFRYLLILPKDVGVRSDRFSTNFNINFISLIAHCNDICDCTTLVDGLDCNRVFAIPIIYVIRCTGLVFCM